MEIYVQKDGQKQGPFTESRIRQGIDAGEFTPNDLAWTTGKASWQPLSSLIGLDVSQPPPLTSTANEEGPPVNIKGDTEPRPPQMDVPLSNKNALSVSKTGNGDFVTITEAIAAAPSGARILIEEGVYEEALIISKPLTLIGKKDGSVRVHHPTFAVLKIENTEAIINDVVLEVPYNRLSISFIHARVDFSGCQIKSASRKWV